MGRIMGIDYGTKRVGLAVTDPERIIASRLETVPTDQIFDYLETYLTQETVDLIVVGEPMHPDGQPAQIAHLVVGFVRRMRKQFPTVEVLTWDERFTSVEAKQIILQGGAGRKKRRDKALVDQVSAVLILEDFLKNHIW